MSNDDKKLEICDFCRKGRVSIEMQEIAFHQTTDKGNIFCRVTIPIGVCDNCGARTWNEPAERIIKEAVRREYDKLPSEDKK